MPTPKLTEFLTDPKHKEEREFMQGVIDARVKEIAEQYQQEKKKKKGSKEGNFFDDLFGGSDE